MSYGIQYLKKFHNWHAYLIYHQILRKKGITRTETSVWFPWENRSGKHLVRSSRICQPESDGSKSIEGNEVFNSPRNLYKSGMLGKEGRQVRSKACIFCRSALFIRSGKCWREWRSITLGTFIAVYMVRERKRKNPIKCL